MKIPVCSRCGLPQSKEDKKLGCARCEWRDMGMDVPTNWVKKESENR